jgi:UDP-glucuronate decarboxylase
VLRLKDAIIQEYIEQIKKSIDAEVFRGKRVLVSGGSGFLGSWICDVLIEVGSKVICLDNLSTGASRTSSI